MDEWPADTINCIVANDGPEVKMPVTVNTTIINLPNATEQRITYFSDWQKLKVAQGEKGASEAGTKEAGVAGH